MSLVRRLWTGFLVFIVLFAVIDLTVGPTGWDRAALVLVLILGIAIVPTTTWWCTLAHTDCKVCGKHAGRFQMVDGFCDGECMAFDLMRTVIPEVVEPKIAEKRARHAA